MQSIEPASLGRMIQVLKVKGYCVVGPTVRDGAVVYAEIGGLDDLPRGVGDEQSAASYRLRDREDGAFFGYTLGPVSWKKFLVPPRATLFSAIRNGRGFDVAAGNAADPPQKMAFLGVRPCELRALELLDKVFLGDDVVDPLYKANRDNSIVIAVNCSTSGGTCFCASMGTGPSAHGGYDIVLTEVTGPDRHYLTVDADTARGEAIVQELQAPSATPAEIEEAEAAVARAADMQGTRLDIEGLPRALKDNFDHPHWDEVARRCLACANCTMVCPTCFCSTVEDVTDLTGSRAERRRRWDSCFSSEFTRVAGGNIRPSVRARYRQWLTHKLEHWVDQFGAMGCVGCGRCITWCPAGIDITAEAAAIRNNGAQV
ncbi:MAG: 4Fe-4S dicluster domain-containing protein [Bacteroidota bacterium]